jgi:hypothetical protein
MKQLKEYLAIVLCCVVVAPICSGQSYATDTAFHDPVQRLFVVEAARLLAWRANRQQNSIAEVSYQVNTASNRDTSWQITWRDGKGKHIKSAKVEYSEGTLKQGPDFYRQALRQVWKAGWTELSKSDSTEAVRSFWDGADQASVSREESLVNAYALLQSTAINKDPSAAKMAGLLTHTALPGVAGRLTLDGTLAARGAVWLALAELSCSNELTHLWAPVLFLSGRDRSAQEAWGKAPRQTPAADQGGSSAAWEVWLRQPTSKEVFLFAAGSTNWPMTMAMLAYDVGVNGSGALLAEALEPLADSRRLLTKLHNYAPLLARRTGVAGGHIMNGAWPVYQRQAWIDVLKTYASSREAKGDFDYTAVLNTATAALRKTVAPDPSLDPSLHGISELAPLLRLGHTQGTGKLVPTAVASAADLLNYGWEATGLQMGSRYRFVAGMWGVREQARPIYQTVLREIPGLVPFFMNEETAKTYNYRQSQQRLENVDGFNSLVGWSSHPFSNASASNKTAAIFVKRCWLRPSEFQWQARSLWDVGDFTQISELIDAFRQEAGSAAAAEILLYLTGIRSDLRAPIPRVNEFMAALADRLPQPTKVYIDSVWEQRFQGKPKLAQAQEMEKLYWRNPDGGLEDWVVWLYGEAGAYKALRRFYAQARENFLDPVRTSNRVGPNAYVAGYLLNDPALRSMALEDSRSGSFKDMMMHIWEAAIRNDSSGLETQVKELIERYESDKAPESTGRRLLGFLPLLPALRDPKHVSHQNAIRYFEKSAGWTVLRWIWIRKYELPKEDAIAFLGGREADLFRRVLISYLENDPRQTADAYSQLEKENKVTGDQMFLAGFLSRQIQNQPSVDNLPDLKPADASSARSAVLARLAARRK